MLRPLPDSDLVLTPAQKAALAHVRDGAAALPTTGEPGAALSRARVSLNFHPDRLAADGRLVIEALRDDGLYRNQFESRVSNGALSAHPGGTRDQWEARLFGDAYHDPPAAGHERPKYGALDRLRFPDGPAPGFGSCHLRLRPAVLARSTLCFGDSHLGPTDLGTLDEPDAVLAGLVEALHATGSALGHSGTVATLLDVVSGDGAWPGDPTEPGRTLDEYIEVQVHGPVRLACDVEALVADPAFRETDIGACLEETSARYGLTLAWHCGFAVEAASVPPDFRGPRVTALAARLATAQRTETLDANHLGEAARSVVMAPEQWSDWGTAEAILQELKRLWHVLVRHGGPARTRTERS